MAWKVKTGDMVFVIAGDAKGSKGKILKVHRKTSRVTVEGINLRARHVRPSVKNPQGGIIRSEQPIHVSNIALVDPDAQETLEWNARLATRVGFRVTPEGHKVRYAKRSQREI